jgi:hypothetical protein
MSEWYTKKGEQISQIAQIPQITPVMLICYNRIICYGFFADKW